MVKSPMKLRLIKPLYSQKLNYNLNPTMVISYKECLKNHAATVGRHAVDGCGEFMPSPTAIPSHPTSLNCAACGCHRNFHRRQPDHPTVSHRRCHPYRPSSPPPLQFSAPHMLLALTTGAPLDGRRAGGLSPRDKKRKRTKFSREQKEKMQFFCEKIGWRIRKGDENLVEEFCGEIGIGKGVLRIWMHNNKYMGGKAERNRGSQSSENGGNGSKQST